MAGLIVPAATAHAEEPARAQPTFVPGLYETESRTSASPKHGERSTGCIPFADVDAYRRETITQFLKTPQFKAICKLSEIRQLPNGFYFAMDCDQAKSIITYTFAKDLVRSTTRTMIVPRPDYSSEIITISRRIGACPG